MNEDQCHKEWKVGKATAKAFQVYNCCSTSNAALVLVLEMIFQPFFFSFLEMTANLPHENGQSVK